jgi:hypothetical protein
MKTCGGCGNEKMRYCLCLECGWMSPKDKKRDDEIRKQIEQGKLQKPNRIEIKTARLDWGKLSNNRVLS